MKKKFYVYVALKNGTVMKGRSFSTREGGEVWINSFFGELTKYKMEEGKGDLFVQTDGLMFPAKEFAGMWIDK